MFLGRILHDSSYLYVRAQMEKLSEGENASRKLFSSPFKDAIFQIKRHLQSFASSPRFVNLIKNASRLSSVPFPYDNSAISTDSTYSQFFDIFESADTPFSSPSLINLLTQGTSLRELHTAEDCFLAGLPLLFLQHAQPRFRVLAGRKKEFGKAQLGITTTKLDNSGNADSTDNCLVAVECGSVSDAQARVMMLILKLWKPVSLHHIGLYICDESLLFY
jgi:hypothetical protein